MTCCCTMENLQKNTFTFKLQLRFFPFTMGLKQVLKGDFPGGRPFTIQDQDLGPTRHDMNRTDANRWPKLTLKRPTILEPISRLHNFCLINCYDDHFRVKPKKIHVGCMGQYMKYETAAGLRLKGQWWLMVAASWNWPHLQGRRHSSQMFSNCGLIASQMRTQMRHL